MYSKLQDGSFLICGYVARDAEVKTTKNGRQFTIWSVAVGQRPKQDGTRETVWTSCKAWETAAQAAAPIRKGDTVLCIGRLETNESGGRTYKNLVCEYISIMAKSCTPPPPEDVSAEDDLDEFGELLDDGSVPF